MRENFTQREIFKKVEVRICEVFDEKRVGIIAAKSFPEKALTVRVDSLEFTNCLPNQNQKESI